MTNFVIGCLTVGGKKTLANYHIKCHGRFLCYFLRIHGYLTREIYLEKVRSHKLTKSSSKRVIFTVKVSRVTAPITFSGADLRNTY